MITIPGQIVTVLMKLSVLKELFFPSAGFQRSALSGPQPIG